MPEGQPAGATPAGEGATPASSDSQQGQPSGQAAATAADQPLGAPGLAALQREREARENAIKERDALAAKVKEFEDRDKSEAQKNAERIQELEQQLTAEQSARRTALAEVATTTAARKANFRNPDLAFRLIAGDVEFDDKGQPKNIDRLLSDLAKTYPDLVSGNGGGSGLGPQGAPVATGNQSMNDIIRRAAGRA